MRTLFVLIALLATSITGWSQETFTALDLQRVKQVREAAISPDGAYIAYIVETPRPIKDGKGHNYRELYVLDLGTGKSEKYISGKNYFYRLKWHPDGAAISFLGKLDDSKMTMVYSIPLGGGPYFPLSEISESVLDYDWSPDASELAFLVHPKYKRPDAAMEKYGFDQEVFEEELTHRQLKVYNLASGEIRTLVDDASVFALDWAPRGKLIAAQIAPQNLTDDSYMFKRIYLIDAHSGRRDKLVDNPGKLTAMAWSPDAKHLAFVAAEIIEDPVAGSLYVQSLDDPKDFSELQNYTEGFEGQVNDVQWQDGNTLFFASYESTKATLRKIDLGEEESELILPGGATVFSRISLAGGVLAMAGNTSTRPSELYTVHLKKAYLKRHTDLNPWVRDLKLGRQESIRYKARDGMEIEGVVIYPADYEEGRRYPLIAMIHGGPESCITDGWQTYYSRWGQIAAGRGYFVFMPNYRGSSGRGLAFSRADYGDLADEEFLDVLDGIQFLVDKGWVDAQKVGIGGGSYGGYFSAWAATKHSDKFRAAVVFVGISDQISKRNTTDIPYEDYYVHWGLWTNENFELVYDRSPVKYSSQNVTPTLILHGKNDPRVHPSQSLELYRSLKMHGHAAVRLIWYPGEGHGNSNNPARLDYCLRTMDWFDFYLQDGRDKEELPEKYLDYGLDLD